jgi:hypothetical protein
MVNREKRGFRADVGRFLVLLVGLVAIAASANQGQNRPGGQAPAPVDDVAPESRPMDAAMALGLWKSSFGAVKIEADSSQGPSYVMGVWAYDREGEEVIGFFDGTLDGNVLQFTWQEPGQPQDLSGAGFIVFEPDGRAFAGKWWSDSRDRSGAWNGWRTDDTMPAASPNDDKQGPAEQAGPPPEDDYL